jgi:NCS1 family nucleobase:cation symporter-1
MSTGSALISAEYIFFFVFIALTGLMLLLDVKRWSILVYAKLIIFTLSAAGEFQPSFHSFELRSQL